MRLEIAVAIALSVAACGGGTGAVSGSMLADPDLPATDIDVTVTSVADGDSFRALAATGELEVRLLGINSPELDECHGQQARNALRDLVEGRDIGLATEPDLDQFGRVLGRAVGDGKYVNLEMILNGHSLVVTNGGPDRPALVAAEELARAGETGLWASDVCGAVGARATLEITDIDYDPPGANERESVTIINTGDAPVELEGFILRDESSTNRFVFPDVVMGPREEVKVVRSCGSVGKTILAWCSDQPIWNNEGDTALLLDRVGRIVAFLRY